MIALLNENKQQLQQEDLYQLNGVFRMKFNKPIRLNEVLDFIKNPINSIRFATNREIFVMLRNSFFCRNGEVVVCLEPGLKPEDDVLVIRSDGPAIITALPVWDTRYSFPVVYC